MLARATSRNKATASVSFGVRIAVVTRKRRICVLQQNGHRKASANFSSTLRCRSFQPVPAMVFVFCSLPWQQHGHPLRPSIDRFAEHWWPHSRRGRAACHSLHRSIAAFPRRALPAGAAARARLAARVPAVRDPDGMEAACDACGELVQGIGADVRDPGVQAGRAAPSDRTTSRLLIASPASIFPGRTRPRPGPGMPGHLDPYKTRCRPALVPEQACHPCGFAGR